jgi:hypothetical protein
LAQTQVHEQRSCILETVLTEWRDGLLLLTEQLNNPLNDSAVHHLRLRLLPERELLQRAKQVLPEEVVLLFQAHLVNKGLDDLLTLEQVTAPLVIADHVVDQRHQRSLDIQRLSVELPFENLRAQNVKVDVGGQNLAARASRDSGQAPSESLEGRASLLLLLASQQELLEFVVVKGRELHIVQALLVDLRGVGLRVVNG